MSVKSTVPSTVVAVFTDGVRRSVRVNKKNSNPALLRGRAAYKNHTVRCYVMPGAKNGTLGGAYLLEDLAKAL